MERATQRGGRGRHLGLVGPCAYSDDKEARHLADCLIQLEQAAIKSKESFLIEMKRLGINPKGE